MTPSKNWTKNEQANFRRIARYAKSAIHKAKDRKETDNVIDGLVYSIVGEMHAANLASDKKHEITVRALNTMAGFVYAISQNLDLFGTDMTLDKLAHIGCKNAMKGKKNA